jgi:cytochrome c oxidase subunit III
MSTASDAVLGGGDPEVTASADVIRSLSWDRSRGTGGMWLFILSETMVFLGLLFAYYYMAAHAEHWPPERAPSLTIPYIITGVLIVSCIILEAGRRALMDGNRAAARIALAIALLAGAVYIWLEVESFREYLTVVTPQQDAYGSIYYTIFAFHGAHLVIGMLLFVFGLLVPLEPTERAPYRVYYNSALYWYFSTVVWILLLCTIDVPPHLYR